MHNLIVREDRQAFNFEDGISVKGDVLSGLRGATRFGCLVSNKAEIVQLWLLAIQQTISQLGSQLSTYTSPDQPLTDQDDSTANTKFVQELFSQKLAEITAGSPAGLNTLGKLSRALANKPQLATEITALLAEKVRKLDIQSDTVSQVTLTVSGSDWVGSFSPTLSSGLIDGMVVSAKAPVANALSAKIRLTGVADTAAYPLVLPDGTALRLGDIPHVGYWMHMQWSAGASRWMLINPAGNLSRRFATVAETTSGLLNNVSVMPVGVKEAIRVITNATAGSLDTFNKLATALGGQANLSANLVTALSAKAPLDSPALTQASVPDTAVTSNDTQVANTRSVQAMIADWGDAAKVPEATSVVVGRILLSDIAKAQAGVNSSSGITPALLKLIMGNYVEKSAPVFIGIPRAPTAADGTNDQTVATTAYAQQTHLRHMQAATTSVTGMAKMATRQIIDVGLSEQDAVSPADVRYLISKIPAKPDSSMSLSGLGRLATDQEAADAVSGTLWMTPKTMRTLINSKLAAYGGSFAAPTIASAASVKVGIGYVITLTAAPSGMATSITSFNLSIKFKDTETVLLAPSNLNATANKLTYTFTPTSAHVGVAQILATAKDNLGYISPLASKDFVIEQVVVNPPVFVFPINGQQDIGHTPTFEVSGFGLNSGQGTHSKTDWKLELVENDGSGFVMLNLLDETTYKTQVTLQDSVLATGYTYRLSVRFHDATYGPSQWSVSTFTVMPLDSTAAIQKISASVPAASAQFGGPAVSRDGVWSIIRATAGKFVDVFKWNNVSSSYEFKQRFTTHDAEPAKFTYGAGVAMNYAGTEFFVGCPVVARSNPASASLGYVYVYRRVGDVWSQAQIIQAVPVGLARATSSGAKVHVDRSGTMLFIQIPNGTVQLYRKDSSDTWIFDYEFINPLTATTGYGLNVSVSADLKCVAISDHTDKNNGSLGGCVFIYKQAEDGTWVSEGSFFPPVMTNNDAFGMGMAMRPSGDVVYAGSPGKTIGSASLCGAIEIFKRVDGVWVHQGTWNFDTPIHNAYLGRSMSLDERGKLLFVGSSYPTVFSSHRGQAVLLAADDITLTKLMEIASPNPSAYTAYANEVAIAPIGRRLFVSQPLATNTLANEGVCHVYNC